ncbi:MAG: hypothetical protein HY367_00565 [Candidatus Aenigmarchaeota archaeon]|nr:hypothetical protein [Candidatus Aenigmarchaeota archaeon]
MNGEEAMDPAQAQQLEEMKKKLLGQMLTKEAFERLARVRVANPSMAAQAELYLLQLFQAGKIREKVTDDKLKSVLQVLTQKKDFSIKRR